ncbi:TPA: hypothetical protein N0F65_007290 [Lagenidium giganteum]|uniref:LicD/FKTN/FKRP nucleotidyltransferase domain-containing protein n=1 Tax=Lagenidium giganteum TaxID=4803 RepID=A0AAV2Z1X4_9STRA|nr:TPA: hypothetical protein N0F65_007290 [Lagenidium giganteum]
MSDQHRDAKFINRHVCYTREQQLQVIRTLVFEMAELLTRHNVTYFLEAGTLLGSFRNKGIIPHDTDADFGMDEPGYEYIRDHVLDDLPVGLFLEVWNSTFHPSDRDDKLPVRLIHKHSALYLDVFVFLDWTKDGKDVVGPLASWCYFNCASCPKVETGGKELRVPREWIYPLVDCELEGRTMKCPHKTEDYLRYVFGGGFMTPQQYH